MTYSQQVQNMCPITKGPKHGPAPIPEEGAWVKAYEIKDISGYTHGVGWCAPQQGTCKLSLNIKNGVIEEALVETIGCSGMTHSAAMAGEILPGKTILEALNTDLVCDAINVAMRELFLQIVYGRSQTAFSEDGLPIGAGLDDLGKGLRSMTGTIFSTKEKGVRYLELTEGYINKLAVDANDEVIGYQFVKLGKMMEDIRHGKTPNEAYEKNVGTYGRYDNMVGKFLGTQVPAVGFSIGFERVCGILLEQGYQIPGAKQKIALLYGKDADFTAVLAKAADLRNSYNVTVLQQAKKLGKQLGQLEASGFSGAAFMDKDEIKIFAQQ